MAEVNHKLTVNCQLSTVTNYQLPITNYQLPITNYQLPITNYQLPITHYPLPIQMYKITLEWSESGQAHSLTFTPNQVTKNPGTIRIGRDKEKCDLVLPDTEKTVSRVHGEIFFNSQTNTFYLRNLTRDQPPNKQNHIMVDSQKVINQEITIRNGSLIQVGLIVLKVSLETIHPEQPINEPHRIRCTNGHILDYKYLNSFCPYCGVAVTGETIIIKR